MPSQLLHHHLPHRRFAEGGVRSVPTNPIGDVGRHPALTAIAPGATSINNICGQCGATQLPGAVFCSFCGIRMAPRLAQARPRSSSKSRGRRREATIHHYIGDSVSPGPMVRPAAPIEGATRGSLAQAYASPSSSSLSNIPPIAPRLPPFWIYRPLPRPAPYRTPCG